jgi:hypothetical protein
LLGGNPQFRDQTTRHLFRPLAPLLVPFCGNSTHLRLAITPHVLTSRIAGLAATVILDANVMTMMPAPLAPFAIGAAVRFIPDPIHVERVIECEWVSLDAAAHWRVTTTWTDEDVQHTRVGDAAEFVAARNSPEAS